MPALLKVTLLVLAGVSLALALTDPGVANSAGALRGEVGHGPSEAPEPTP